MTLSSCLTDEDHDLVMDTSVVINVLATGHASSILSALAIPIIVTENVVQELDRGQSAGYPQGKQLRALIADSVVRVEGLDDSELELFMELVSGRTERTLGDGEAATLAMSYSRGTSAAVDEKRATQIARSRFAGVRLVTTVDILAHPGVRTLLGRDTLSEATFLALTEARMQVHDHQFDWIAQLIGPAKVEACRSLARHARRRQMTT
ncbi:PIN domain-containing protein [Cupriavidus sp. RAF20_2]|uniref:PIN domain-containing protein n=1 Tax=Cupriavidus sp. RAF20_2 TaxID=3233053 RepID=UPI003F8DEA03